MRTIYLGDAFGWDTDMTAKVAIAQLREEKIISVDKCIKAQLITNESIRWQPNTLKMLGYIPGVNVIAGIVAMVYSGSSPEYNPEHTVLWNGRGVSMIFCGPFLFVVDLVVHLYNLYVAGEYSYHHPNLMESFNTAHGHTSAYWPGHPVRCQ